MPGKIYTAANPASSEASSPRATIAVDANNLTPPPIGQRKRLIIITTIRAIIAANIHWASIKCRELC